MLYLELEPLGDQVIVEDLEESSEAWVVVVGVGS